MRQSAQTAAEWAIATRPARTERKIKYLETNEAVLHNVNTTDAVLPGRRVHCGEQLHGAFANCSSAGRHFNARWQP